MCSAGNQGSTLFGNPTYADLAAWSDDKFRPDDPRSYRVQIRSCADEQQAVTE
jgi:hypothetical protein